MSNRYYDVVIIGGGIHGAGVAQAAAAAGYSVLVLEQKDLASGTSSRSSKLIHGGLRYLESGQFSLVRECLYERALLLKNAPELVKLKKFFIPVYQDTTRRPWQLRTGLSLYALLGGLHHVNLFSTIPKKQWDTLDGLETKNLQSVFCYYDAQTDDAALTHAVMESALKLGAELKKPAMVNKIELTDQGSTIHYIKDETQQSCKAGVVVNAAGPWVNQVIGKVIPTQSQHPVELVQGTHIIVEGELGQGIYYLEAPSDKRAVFAMPWYGQTLVGTTETTYQGNPADVVPLETEQHYLLTTLEHYFPDYRNQKKILKSFAGLRVLPKDSGSAFKRTRETILHQDRTDKPRIVSIYGGKLTAFRATAEKVIKTIRSSLPESKPVADTRTLAIHPADTTLL